MVEIVGPPLPPKRKRNRTPLYPSRVIPLNFSYEKVRFLGNEEISRDKVNSKLTGALALPGHASGLRKGRSWRIPTDRRRGMVCPISLSGSLEQDLRSGYSTSYLGQYPPVRSGPDLISCDYVNANGIPRTDLNISNRCSTQVLNNLTRGQLQLGADAAEAKKTAVMIAKGAKDILTAYSAVKHGKWGEVLKILGISRHSFKKSRKDISGRWLELQYGWLPTLGTISDGIALNQRRAAETKLPMRVIRNITDPYHLEIISSLYPGTKIYNKGTRGCRIILWYTILDDDAHLLSQLGVNNPFSIGWELLPFSFVLDWFMPVGEVLSAWSATSGLKFISGTKTWRVTGSAECITDWEAEYGNGYKGTSRAVYSYDGYDRISLSTWPYTFLYVKSPFSGRHITNAIALINQRWK